MGDAKYRIIDFKRNILDIPATVERIEYDPNRSAHIALIKYKDGDFRYIICPQKLKKGDQVISSKKNRIRCWWQVKDMPTDTLIHNIELRKAGKRSTIMQVSWNLWSVNWKILNMLRSSFLLVK